MNLKKIKDSAEYSVYTEKGTPQVLDFTRGVNPQSSEIASVLKKANIKLFDKSPYGTHEVKFVIQPQQNKKPLRVYLGTIATKKQVEEQLASVISKLHEAFPEGVDLKRDSQYGWNLVVNGTAIELPEASLITINSVKELQKHWEEIFEEGNSSFRVPSDTNLIEEVQNYIERSFEDVGDVARITVKKDKDDPKVSIVKVRS